MINFLALRPSKMTKKMIAFKNTGTMDPRCVEGSVRMMRGWKSLRLRGRMGGRGADVELVLRRRSLPTVCIGLRLYE
jgi:hypothetical protein